jgi:hypothetical protein
VRGYVVVTSDDRAIGTVVDVRDGFLIVESGRLRKSRRPVPREFVHPADEAAMAVVTAPRTVLMDAPKVDKDGEFDRVEAARHFGLLAESYLRQLAGDDGLWLDPIATGPSAALDRRN